MPVPSSTAANAAEEMFPDDFRAEALDVLPFDVTVRATAFEPYALTVGLRSAFLDRGLIAPLELIVVDPEGSATVKEVGHVPFALAFVPQVGGDHRVTVREIAHMRWWGGATVTVDGEANR